MNCCHGDNHNNENNHNNHKGHMSHIWMMLLCCGAPIILLFVLPLLGSRVPGLKGVLTGIIPFLCPIMMLVMIPMMMKKDKENGNKNNETKRIEGKHLE